MKEKWVEKERKSSYQDAFNNNMRGCPPDIPEGDPPLESNSQEEGLETKRKREEDPENQSNPIKSAYSVSDYFLVRAPPGLPPGRCGVGLTEGGAGAGGPPPPPLESEDNPAILKTTPKQIVLKPPSSKHKPGIKPQKKRKLTNTDVPINQRKINTMFKPKLDKTTQNATSNPTIVTNSDRMDVWDRKDGQSNSLSSTCQNLCQKLEDKELSFLHQDEDTCPDLGESSKFSFSLL